MSHRPLIGSSSRGSTASSLSARHSHRRRTSILRASIAGHALDAEISLRQVSALGARDVDMPYLHIGGILRCLATPPARENTVVLRLRLPDHLIADGRGNSLTGSGPARTRRHLRGRGDLAIAKDEQRQLRAACRGTTGRTGVVDQDEGVPGFHIVRVRRVDGEVVDSRLLRPRADRVDLHPRPGAGLEPLAGLQFTRLEPLLQVRDPEGMAGGRGDGVGGLALVAVRVDRELDELLLALALDRVGDLLTSSPSSTLSMGLPLPAAISTGPGRGSLVPAQLPVFWVSFANCCEA
ncbi:hypothetical protein SAURM35S_08762 [Streptomyces aurantiogriseus]